MGNITYEDFMAHTGRGRPSIYQPFLELLTPGGDPLPVPVSEGTSPTSAVTGLRQAARRLGIKGLVVKEIDGVYLACRLRSEDNGG